jgi:hypothetical protein
VGELETIRTLLRTCEREAARVVFLGQWSADQVAFGEAWVLLHGALRTAQLAVRYVDLTAAKKNAAPAPAPSTPEPDGG